MYSMFFSSVGIISDHVARRVHELDNQKVHNRVRKDSEVYKRREAHLELERLADAEQRKKAAALKNFEYKACEDCYPCAPHHALPECARSARVRPCT